MSQFYNITGYQEGGEPWSNEHGTFQTFWCDFEGVEGGVMLNKKQGSVPAIGQVFGDLISAVSQSGNQYWKFKSQKKPQGVSAPAPAQQPVQAAPAPQQPVQQPQRAPQHAAVPQGDTMPQWFVPVYNMIKYIFDEMKKMDTSQDDTPGEANLGTMEPTAPPAPTPATAQAAAVTGGEQTTVPPDVFTQPPTTAPAAPAPTQEPLPMPPPEGTQ